MTHLSRYFTDDRATEKEQESALGLVRSCISRWAIEETIRYIKKSYELEDVLVSSYRSLQKLMPIVWAAAYSAAVLLDTAS